MPIAHGAVALLFAMGALASLAGAVGFFRVRLWWGVVMLVIVSVMFVGAATSFGQRALG